MNNSANWIKLIALGIVGSVAKSFFGQPAVYQTINSTPLVDKTEEEKSE